MKTSIVRARRSPVAGVSVVLLVAGLFVGGAMPAAAHHPIVSGSLACAKGWKVVTWTVANSETTSGSNRTMIVKAFSVSRGTVDGGLAVGQQYPPRSLSGSSRTFTSTFDDLDIGLVTLTVTAGWVDSQGNAAGPQNEVRSTTVDLSKVVCENRTCGSFQGTGQTWQELKVDPGRNGTFTTSAGSVTISGYDGDTFDWTSTFGIDAVFVKGGSNGSNIYVYDPPSERTSDSDNGVPNPANNGISHISFCWDDDPDLRVEKSADAATVSAGDSIGFTMTVSNAGSSAAGSVVLSDPLPVAPGLVWTVDPPVAGCSIAAETLTCAFGSLDPKTTRTVHVSSPAPSSACATHDNVATAAASNDGPATASARTTILCPDVRAQKSTSTPGVSAGDLVRYRVVVENIGAGVARNVVVSDVLPAGLAWSLDAAVAGCAVAGGSLDCAIPLLASGDSVTLDLSAPTTPQQCGTHENSVLASAANEHESDRANNADGPVTVEVNCSSVHITKSADEPAVSAGEPIGFTLTVENDGSGEARDVKIVDVLPVVAGTSWSVDGGSLADACAIAAGILTCDAGTLEPGESATVHVSSPTTHASCGEIVNEAEVAAGFGAGDRSAASVSVRCPDLRVAKTAHGSPVTAGDEIGFAIAVSNAGPGSAFGVTVADSLPSGLEWTIAPPVDGCEITSGALECALGTVAAGNDMTINVTAGTDAGDCGSVDNTASAAATNHAPMTSSAVVTVECPSLTIDKTADDAEVDAGDGIGFTITVVNNGAGVARDVVVTDLLPVGDGIEWAVDPAVNGCAITAAALRCDLGSLGAGDERSVRVSSATTAESCGTYENMAVVVASNAGSPSSATASATVACAQIGLAKTADAELIEAGDLAGFTITASNDGAGEARGVTVTDPLPVAPGLAWTIDDGTMSDACAIEAGVLTCSLASLGSGESRTVHVVSPTGGSSCGPLLNVANVTSSNDGTAQASATILVTCPAGIQIVKDGPSLAHRGDTITYTMIVTPTTITPLTNVTVTDPLCDAAPQLLVGDDGDLVLEPGESWAYGCSRTITGEDPDPLPNTATATGVGFEEIVTDSDDHEVDLIAPAISIDKSVTPLSGTVGTTVTYTYVVTNTGDTTLFDVLVDDDKLGVIGTIAQLGAGESNTLTQDATLGAIGVTNIGTATGSDVLGKEVSDSDTASVTVVAGVKLVSTGVGFTGWKLGVGLLVVGFVLVLATRRRTA